MAVILVVDDVEALAEQYAYDLARMGGYETRVATGGRAALDTIAFEAVDCVILDLEMPGMDGFEVLRELRRDGVTVPVVVYTGTGDFERCVRAIKLGATGFIDKAEPMARVVQEVENALDRSRLDAEVRALRHNLGADSALIGASAPMMHLKEQIARVAPVPSPVLVVGASGTGKELVALELHRHGPGARKPFVAVNCAALPDNLVESELFGHERGAFTGANRTHRGAFEAAGGGTLFLDEIGELPAAAQAKLLRVLEERQVTRIGGERTIAVDARVVAATHRDLADDIDAGRFRQDLYYRLNAHVLAVPPLCDRRSDIPEIAAHLLAGICDRFGVRAKTIAPEAMDVLMAGEWKRNNVRELRNVIERMVLAADGDTIGVAEIPIDVRDDIADTGARSTGDDSLQAQKAEAERRIIVAALERHDWHITRTAQALGLADHASLLKIMRRHGLKRR